jgi:hypothetical protein
MCSVRMYCDSHLTGIATRIIINAARTQPMTKVVQLNWKNNRTCLIETIKFNIRLCSVQYITMFITENMTFLSLSVCAIEQIEIFLKLRHPKPSVTRHSAAFRAQEKPFSTRFM